MIDTGVFYSFFDTRDEYYLDSLAMLTHCIEGKFGQPFTTDYVILETSTLLQKRLGSDVALAFISFLSESRVSTFIVEGEFYKNTIKLFKKQAKRLSLCDSATIVAMSALNISALASYDRRSFFGLVGRIHGEKYFKSLSEEDEAKIRKLVVRK